MLRPERMSKVSVTGSKGVMPTVIETVHELNLVHLSDYDGSWDGFDNGNPIEGADDVSEKLVTVRALENTLELERPNGAAGATTIGDDWEDRLERIRTAVNELDDRQTELREERRSVEERTGRVAPFADLGIDLDLLRGYDAVDVVVGDAPVEAIESALEGSDDVRTYETFTGGDLVAIVAAPTGDDPAGIIDDALVGIEFERHPVPETDRSPSAYIDELTGRREELETALEAVEEELSALADEHGSFLLELETELTIEAQRADAPLRFATTRRAFVAEGWVPTEAVDRFEAALRDAVGDRVEIEEIERAEYEASHEEDAHTDDEGPGVTDGEETAGDADAPRAAADGGTKPAAGAGVGKAASAETTGDVRTDGGSNAVTMDSEPPVVLDNLTPAKPFEMMVKMVSQPKYSELDPTLLIFLTYPFAFGFMIGDIGYGLLYMLMGFGAWKLFDSDAGKALGTIGIWAGAFTVIFGWLYDDFFGIHMSDVGLELPLAGTLNKGLQLGEWALLWIVLSILFGLVHLNIGLVLGFVNELAHGLKAAVFEKGSWILSMNGLFIWIFAHQDAGSFDSGLDFLPDDLVASGTKPEFLVGTSEEAVLYEFLGFAGLPEVVGIVGLVAALVGFVMVSVGEGIAGVAEWIGWSFGHVLSYLRMVAVLLAKGGMAFAVNLLVFGAYATEEGYTYFNYPGLDIETISGYATADLTPEFVGLIHLGDGPILTAIAVVAAIVVFVLGHILVLLLGITAAGIQMLRLEYVEFFQKFYEGGGEEYDPFGYESAGETTSQA